MMQWMGSEKASYAAEIARLEGEIERLLGLRNDVVRETTLYPGCDSRTARENWRREQNRREGLRAIDQSIAGARQQVEFLRREWRKKEG
jgi:hypothetical protein